MEGAAAAKCGYGPRRMLRRRIRKGGGGPGGRSHVSAYLVAGLGSLAPVAATG